MPTNTCACSDAQCAPPPDSQTRARTAARWLVPLAIGCAAFLLTFFTLGDRVIPSADEGIYLQGGANLLRGAVPYRDFFALTGPGNFWLVAAFFDLGGMSLRSARALTAFDISLMAALAFWLVARFVGRLAALGTSALLLAICLSSPGNAVVNHRWDSSACALVAICAGLYAAQTGRRPAASLAGAMAVLAAWITPSTVLVGVMIAVWLRFHRRAFFTGAAVCIALPCAVLAWQHALFPMFESLYWTGTHYGQANRSGYGAVFGGAAALFAGAHGGQLPVRILLLTPFLLPALLPPLMAIAWLPALRDLRRPEVYLLGCGGALVASTWPRWDLLHLLYVSPIFLVLAALWMQRARLEMARVAVFLLLFIPAVAMCAQSLMGDGSDTVVATPVGSLRVSKAGARPLQMTLAHVHPGDSLFVFPYEPFYYFLTGAQNPTRYLWLQPGMMNASDERAALAGLASRPPEWILYRDLAPADYLRIWPGSDPVRLRMNSIENWIRTNYRPEASAPSPDGVRELWKRR